MENGYEGQHIEDVLAESGEVTVSTCGTSMYPMLRHRRDMIVVERVTRPLKRNDVPLYRLKSGKLVLHRILKVEDDFYIIRGDNLLEKEHINKDMIIGVLKCFYREGKYFSCKDSHAYHLYVFWINISFPLRKLWKTVLRPFLAKIKHLIFG